MPSLRELTHSHEDAVRAFRGFYTLLLTMYVDEASVAWPPEGGWPDITPDRYAGMNKSPEVISLLRELPYPTYRNYDTEPLPGVRWANWADVPEEVIESQDFSGELIMSEGIGNNGERSNGGVIPPHVFAITMGDRENANIFVDTKRGVIFWDVMCPDDLAHAKRVDIGGGCIVEQVTGCDDDDLPERTKQWPISGPCWTITDFFELIKYYFQSLQFMAVWERDVDYFWGSDNELGDEGRAMREVYRRHGWPPAALGGEGDYDKAGCLKALKRLAEEHFPDRVLWPSDEEED